MKKVLACLMVVCALLAFGCSGRNAAFGVVDMKKVETEAPAVKTIKEDLQKNIYEVSSKLYQQAAPQGQPGQPSPDMGGAAPNQGAPQGGNDGNVYDADFTDVDDNK